MTVKLSGQSTVYRGASGVLDLCPVHPGSANALTVHLGAGESLVRESLLKKMRLVPVAVALLVTSIVAWNVSASKERTVLVFSTGSEVGLYHRLAKQMKRVIETHHPDIVIELNESAGSNENIRRLDSGQADLALVQNDAIGGSSVRSLASLYPEVLHLLCRTDAEIDSLEDLSGHRIGVGAHGSGTEQIATRLLQFVGVEPRPEPFWRGSFSEAIRRLKSDEIDAAFLLIGLGAEVINDALHDEQLDLAPIQMRAVDGGNPDEISKTFTEGFRVHYPHTSPQTIPLMAYDGRPRKPVPSLSVQAVIACGSEIDPTTVERITRTLFEQRAVLSQRESAFTQLDEQKAQTRLQFPLHEGAENYFRRRDPGFLSQHAESMGFVVTLLLLTWSVVTWVRRWYVQGRKNRVDTFYQAIEAVSEQIHEAGDAVELAALESELVDIRRRATDELIQEQLAADSSYIVFQNMLGTCQALLELAREELRVSGSESPAQPAE